MLSDLNAKRMMENIRLLITSRNLKVSDIETHIGISAGYLGRMIRKGEAANPSIDIIWKLANYFDVSMERLVDGDVTDMNDNLALIIATMKFCRMQTLCGQIVWQPIVIDEINKQLHAPENTKTTIPIIGYRKRSIPLDERAVNSLPAGISESCFKDRAICSYMFPNTKLYATAPGYRGQMIEDKWFHIYKLGGFFLPIQSETAATDQPVFESFYDVWIEDEAIPDKRFSYVCTTKGADLQLRETINDMYETVAKAQTDIRLKPEVRDLLKSFLSTNKVVT